MEHLVTGVRDALAKESWYAALALTLTLPDTCGSIEDPGPQKSKKRSIAWFDSYAAKYFRPDPPNGQQFLTGEDFYALRCSFLHEGDFDVNSGEEPTHILSVLNRVRLRISNLQMVPARSMGALPAGSHETSYDVMVQDFCEWVCKAVEEWLLSARQDSSKSQRLAELARIEVWTYAPDYSFTVSSL